MSSVILYTRFKVWKWNRLFVHEYKLNGFIYTADLNLNLVLFMTKSWIYSVTCASITFISKITWNRKKYTDDLRSFPPSHFNWTHLCIENDCWNFIIHHMYKFEVGTAFHFMRQWAGEIGVRMDGCSKGHLMRCAHRTAFPATCYMSLRN